MKILYYSAHPHLNLSATTGYGTHMREVIQGFKNLGHEVETLIIGGEEKLPKKQNSVHNSIFKKTLKKVIPSIIWETIKDIQLLKLDKSSEKILNAKILNFAPDLIYERGYYLIESGIKNSKKHNIKHYLELNAPYVEERVLFSGKSLLLSKAKKIELNQLKSVEKIIVVTSSLKDYFLKKENQLNITVTPNAITSSKIKINETNKNSIIKKHNLKNNLIIGFVGSIFPYHGVDLLIKAFSKIALTKSNVKLLIVGDGEILDELKKLSVELNISKQIIFTGKVPHSEVFDYLATMDITVAAKAAWYNSPVKIFEYGYMEKSVIAPDYQAIKDVLSHRKNSLLIAPSVSNLISSIEELIEDKELRKQLASQLKIDILENHTWDKVAERILNFPPKL